MVSFSVVGSEDSFRFVWILRAKTSPLSPRLDLCPVCFDKRVEREVHRALLRTIDDRKYSSRLSVANPDTGKM